MSAPALTETLGPRGRRRVQIGTIAGGLLVVGLVVFAGLRFASAGELEGDLWEPFLQASTWRYFAGGLLNTVKAALLAMALAMAIGGIVALGRLSLHGIVRTVTRVYVEFFRAMPVLLFILFAFLGLPRLGFPLSRYAALVAALAIYNSAVLAEVFRAGILSLERGQTEAAYSIGLTYWQAQMLVIIPQAIRRMVPAIVAQLATLTKDTALGFVIGYEELLRRGRNLGEFEGNVLQSLVVSALVYIALIFALSTVAHRLETRQRRRYHAAGIQVAGAGEDLAGAEVAEPEERRPVSVR
jgi:glutamate transport system permease protein